MPTKQLERWAREADKSIEEAEACWDKAKRQANILYKDKERDPHYWGYVNNATRKCLGLVKPTKHKLAHWRA